MENKDLFESISRRLGVLIALQLNFQSEKFSITEGVELLTRFNLDPSEIAEILGTSPSVVSVTKTRIKNKKKK